MRFTIVIPTFNESATLAYSLKALIDDIDYLSEIEIIVSDGGSSDDTCAQANRFPVMLVHSEKGRAVQMNTGADKALGEYLLFLHADTRLPHGWQNLITSHTADWGFFQVRLSGAQRLLRVVEKLMNYRSRTTAIATGDQAMFFRREFFQRLGGFPTIPLMEDIAMSKLARAQAAPACIDTAVITSSRRWEHKGIVRTILLMWWLRFAYWLGMSPQRLHRWYYS